MEATLGDYVEDEAVQELERVAMMMRGTGECGAFCDRRGRNDHNNPTINRGG